MNTEELHTMNDEGLKMMAFGEGIPPISDDTLSEEIQTITVYKDSYKIQSPLGTIETSPFLELLWRQTGADCGGEEEDMVFPDGKTYHIILQDSKN
jgi:hypothetical protein